MKFLLPILLVSLLLLLEAVALRLWLRDQLFSLEGLLHLILVLVAPFLALLVPVVVLSFTALLPLRKVKRTLRLDEKGIRLSQTRYDRVRWKDVRRWFFAPVSGKENLLTLTLEYGSGKQAWLRYWSIILDKREQKYALLAELEYLRQRGRSEAPVMELSQPMPRRKPALQGMWAMGLAYYLLMHGFPLLGVGVLPHDSKDSSPSRFTPAEETKIEQGMRQVIKRLKISNMKQFRMLFWVPGAVLTGTGLGCFVGSWRRQSRQAAAINQLYDLELAGLACSQQPIPNQD
ncbi:MAG TPA: hypothetical protein VNZ22_19605 [Bacillota bacterium]|nr:hypothetical protein [Bacillota bacterium]